jgi:hypothetical protein
VDTLDKLVALAEAAKYDASCASSGADKRHSLRSGGIGSTEGMGFCHADTPDGRCVSPLKIVLTHFGVFDCADCVNRVSSNMRCACFAPAGQSTPMIVGAHGADDRAILRASHTRRGNCRLDWPAAMMTTSATAEASASAFAPAGASHFCLGKSNQNRSRPTRAGAIRPHRCPALLAASGIYPLFGTAPQTRFAQTRAPLRPLATAVLGSL